MKLGIITYHRAVNYGAVLQTFALQKVLDKLEVENEIIDYRCKHIEKLYKPLYSKKIKNISDVWKVIAGSGIKRKKRKQFFDFINKNIRCSKKIYTSDNIADANDVYDSFITGSDQVFNFRCSSSDARYFLDFVKDNKKKNSYAASFGVEKVTDEYADDYKRLLSTFENISVRERHGIKIVKDLSGKDAYEVLDPTLLLSKNDWSEFVNTECAPKNKYILIYAMVPSKKMIEVANKLQKDTGLEIVFIKDALTKEGDNELKGDIKYKKHAGPLEFVELFLNAEYVITNSFHGTAFSINFNKKFYTELLPPEKKVNSRLENILDMLELRDRLIENADKIIYEEIDYDKVNLILEEKRKQSMNYLTNNIINH